ncbi:polysaccharide deacetylase family protein [Ligilactobacillus ceti]|uniref:NodB homology domain-containing protein n=1 Tax=Ligilactobacillus ceti DSM 22408 TaxID=1122146 RepID=A0A0R2KHF0_9LACO|nr:polysaccharide deacetylase family protein [Ligilactobacillus ceti]KRN88819.1 hypothetical protein IV53_GL000789 [Ligilactobacillus ceti DSM 22408]
MSKHLTTIAKISAGVLATAALVYTGLPTAYYRGRQKLKKQSTTDKVVYLTFDDGPSQDTPALLALLEKYHVPASFFVVGDFVKDHPETILAMQKAGHAIGTHSKDHTNAMFFTPQQTVTDFAASQASLRAIGVEPHFYRPPWGQFNLLTAPVAHKAHTKIILWDVMAEDWRATSTVQQITHKLRKRVKPGSIICLHDGRGRNQAPKRTIAALEIFIPELLAQGYRFATVAEIE